MEQNNVCTNMNFILTMFTLMRFNCIKECVCVWCMVTSAYIASTMVHHSFLLEICDKILKFKSTHHSSCELMAHILLTALLLCDIATIHSYSYVPWL